MQRTTADAPSPGPSAAHARHPLLFFVHGPVGAVELPRELALPPGRTVVGRDASAGVRLDDARVSRAHAVLERTAQQGDVVLCDEGSRHGSFVNGARVAERPLADGDVLRFGDSHLVFRLAPDPCPDAPVPSLVGVSPAMRELRATLTHLAPHRATVLLSGPSGTGKELAARALHDASGRSGPFVAVNAAALPAELFESQLFGHAPGAFTGARGAQPGLFRAADRGTLFLDEVGELALGLQPKLLRALEEGAVTPVGEVQPVACDVRFVAATNRDLASAVAVGAFRGDLYARLAELVVALPPLALRREDVLWLLRVGAGKEPLLPLAPELVAALLAHDWPFNVRELLAVGQELRIRGAGAARLELELVRHRLPGPAAAATDARHASAAPPGAPEPEPATRAAAPSREELALLLRAANGNVGAVARATGRSRMQVYRWIEAHGLDLERYRKE
ncbi:MAG: sigma 54-interacting transcriptional regulator [Myxococcales bacterium]|nr:sigma 54-interacting transcriptional regulator [Myxococcales bacterium]